MNSSDSEYAGASDGEERRRSRTKVNLRHLEERLNMIQEECNRLSEESDDELSATIDDRSEKNYLDDAEALDSRNNNDESEEDVESDREEEEVGRLQDNSVFGKIDLFLDNVNLNKKGSGRSRSEGWTFSDCESESPRHHEKILEQGLARNNKAFLVRSLPRLILFTIIIIKIENTNIFNARVSVFRQRAQAGQFKLLKMFGRKLFDFNIKDSFV